MSDPDTKQTTPNPPGGSEAAIALGCTCPVMDNRKGEGLGVGMFWITAGCPLHTPKNWNVTDAANT